MTLSHLRPAAFLMSAAMVVTALAVTAGARQQTPAPQTETKPIVRPIPAPPDVAAPPPDAAKTKSGLATMVVTPGTGTEHPKADAIVTVHYTGWNTKGEMFDSSYTRGKPSTFGLNRVIAGWGETVQLMVVGEKRRAWIPEELAYKGRPDRPQGMLVFDIELMSFMANPTTAPEDVAKAPAGRPEDEVRPRLQSAAGRHRHRASEAQQQGDRALYGLDDGREDVRQLGREGASRPRSRWTRSFPAGPRACS